MWKKVNGFEDYYEVSSTGVIKSIRTGKIIKSRPDKDGYLRVSLWTKDGGTETKGVHRIVAQAFIPNLEDKPQVNHIDGDKENNGISNLEWVTNLENQIHALKTGLRKGMVGEKHHNARLSTEDIERIRLLFKKGQSAISLSEEFQVNVSHIYRIVKKEAWV